jgi:hypothetical protein
VPVRLSDERWRHIVEHHDDLAGHYHDVLETVATPMRSTKVPAVSCWRSAAMEIATSWCRIESYRRKTAS